MGANLTSQRREDAGRRPLLELSPGMADLAPPGICARNTAPVSRPPSHETTLVFGTATGSDTRLCNFEDVLWSTVNSQAVNVMIIRWIGYPGGSSTRIGSRGSSTPLAHDWDPSDRGRDPIGGFRQKEQPDIIQTQDDFSLPGWHQQLCLRRNRGDFQYVGIFWRF